MVDWSSTAEPEAWVLAYALMPVANASDLQVGPGQPYATIAAAVAAASPGDTVVLNAGTYVESVNVPMDLAFVGVGDPVWRPPSFPGASALWTFANTTLRGVVFDGRGRQCVGVTGPAFGPALTIRVDSTTFRDCSRGLWVDGTATEVSDSRFVSNGLALVAQRGRATVVDCTFVGNREVGWAEIDRLEGNTFLGNAAGPVVLLEGPTDITGNRFCDNGGGALWLDDNYGAGRGAVSVVDNVFADNRNTSPSGSGGLAIDSGQGRLQILVVNNTFAGNLGPEGAHLHVARGEVTLLNNIFEQGTGSEALWRVLRPSALVRGDWNLFFSNGPGDLRGLAASHVGANTLFGVDPAFSSFSLDGDCANDDLTPLPGSPLIDGGAPAVLDDDGSRSDLGWRGY